jgi:hypothetical protein
MSDENTPLIVALISAGVSVTTGMLALAPKFLTWISATKEQKAETELQIEKAADDGIAAVIATLTKQIDTMQADADAERERTRAREQAQSEVVFALEQEVLLVKAQHASYRKRQAEKQEMEEAQWIEQRAVFMQTVVNYQDLIREMVDTSNQVYKGLAVNIAALKAMGVTPPFTVSVALQDRIEEAVLIAGGMANPKDVGRL